MTLIPFAEFGAHNVTLVEDPEMVRFSSLDHDNLDLQIHVGLGKHRVLVGRPFQG